MASSHGVTPNICSSSWYGYKGFMTRQIPTLLAFLRPKFHPNDDDTTELLNKWRAELGFNLN